GAGPGVSPKVYPILEVEQVCRVADWFLSSDCPTSRTLAGMTAMVRQDVSPEPEARILAISE
ncbi:MAG: hypothetical protein Q8S56_07280, partial [Polaromonas sp.]|nr:hypothetical protein [Polaromonas sp.]